MKNSNSEDLPEKLRQRAHSQQKEAQLARWESQVSQLEAQLTQLSADARLKLADAISEAREARDEAADKLQAYKARGEAAAAELKSGLEKAWSEATAAVERARVMAGNDVKH